MASGEALYGPLADQIARKHGLDPRLFRRLISAESGWNPNAVSPAGARGLTQVVPKWHPDANLSTPAGQLEAGARYLESGIKKYGNPRDALSQYNSGRPWSQGQRISETRNYVNKILGGYSPSSVAPGAAMPGVPPAPGAPGAADLAPVSGSLDVKRLMPLLNQQRQRVLQGQMPTSDYQQQLSQIVQGALPRAQVAAAGAGIGAGVATVATALNGVAADASSKQAINAAKSALGTPYSWGGGTPSGPTKGFGRGANTVGFDCSSLVQMAWAKAGVKLPRTTYEQIKTGSAVNASSPGSWKPGDLLFPSTGHVQMYIGGGKVIEAPRTGGKVQIVPIRSKYIAVRRPA